MNPDLVQMGLNVDGAVSLQLGSDGFGSVQSADSILARQRLEGERVPGVLSGEEGLGTLESSAPILVLLPLLIIEVGRGVRRLKLIARECFDCSLDLECSPGWPFHRRAICVCS